MNCEIHFVCVSHDLSVYNRYVGTNPYVIRHRVRLYDNSEENIPITRRYNRFIEEEMLPGTWVVFIHHDFEFHVDPEISLSCLDRNSIYGPTGACLEPGPLFISLSCNGITNLSVQMGRVREYRHYGRIGCLPKFGINEKCGMRIETPKKVNTLDCCCLVVHSDLIQYYDLRFDERLDWHLYVEDFCLTALQKHNINSYVVQWNCGHYGEGGRSPAFYKCKDIFMDKHLSQKFATTVGIRQGERDRRKIEQYSRWTIFL